MRSGVAKVGVLKFFNGGGTRVTKRPRPALKWPLVPENRRLEGPAHYRPASTPQHDAVAYINDPTLLDNCDTELEHSFYGVTNSDTTSELDGTMYKPPPSDRQLRLFPSPPHPMQLCGQARNLIMLPISW